LRVEVEQQSRTKSVNKTELRHSARVRTVIVRISSPGHRHRPGKDHFIHSLTKKEKKPAALEGFEGGFQLSHSLIFIPMLIINFYSELELA
jgi:hypothetical protein